MIKAYLEWESIELSEENAFAVQIPVGFGHAFISLQDDTIQFFLWTEVATMLVQNKSITRIQKSALNYLYPFPK